MWKRGGHPTAPPSFLFVQPAAAQDALRGKLLYHDIGRITGAGVSCIDCHGGVPGALHGLGKVADNPAAIAYALGAVPQMLMLRGRLTDTDMADIAAYVATPTVASPDLQRTMIGAAASPYSDQRLEFASPGTSTVRLTNTGVLGLRLDGEPAIFGPAAADFAVRATDCRSGVLEPAHSCIIEIDFAPRGLGLRTAALRIEHAWIGGGMAVGLIGRGD